MDLASASSESTSSALGEPGRSPPEGELMHPSHPSLLPTPVLPPPHLAGQQHPGGSRLPARSRS